MKIYLKAITLGTVLLARYGLTQQETTKADNESTPKATQEISDAFSSGIKQNESQEWISDNHYKTKRKYFSEDLIIEEEYKDEKLISRRTYNPQGTHVCEEKWEEGKYIRTETEYYEFFARKKSTVTYVNSNKTKEEIYNENGTFPLLKKEFNEVGRV